MFEILDHPSDVGILAVGATRREALLEASRGVMSLIVNTAGLETAEERVFTASGSDEAAQIVNWVNEILFFFDTEGFISVEFSIDSWNEHGISGHARGTHFDPTRHEFRTAVKAATFHQFESRSTPQGWEIRIFVYV